MGEGGWLLRYGVWEGVGGGFVGDLLDGGVGGGRGRFVGWISLEVVDCGL